MITILAILGPILAIVLIGTILYMAMNLTLRKVFLYIFASVGLVLTIIGLVTVLNLGLKTYIFTKADNYCFERSIPSAVKPDGQELTEAEKLAQEEENRRICEEQRTASRQSQAANSVALLIVGVPLYFYHWNRIRKDKEI